MSSNLHKLINNQQLAHIGHVSQCMLPRPSRVEDQP